MSLPVDENRAYVPDEQNDQRDGERQVDPKPALQPELKPFLSGELPTSLAQRFQQVDDGVRVRVDSEPQLPKIKSCAGRTSPWRPTGRAFAQKRLEAHLEELRQGRGAGYRLGGRLQQQTRTFAGASGPDDAEVSIQSCRSGTVAARSSIWSATRVGRAACRRTRSSASRLR